MAIAAPGEAKTLDFDRHLRRMVWVLTGVIALAAAIVHAGKVADERSAFIRWRPQVIAFWGGENIYETHHFPNPPIMPIMLLPLMALPPVTGGTCWFLFKLALTAIAVAICFRIVRPTTGPLPSWFQAGVLVFSLRPILSDLHHGNNNLIILFLIVAALECWRRGYDVLAGLVLALSISYKVTPALFVFYFMIKGSWRLVAATLLGLGLFLLVVPSMVIGPRFNALCLGAWWHHMLSPFLTKGASSPQEINQSMIGVLTRLLTATKIGDGRYDVHMAVNLVSWPGPTVSLLLKGLSVGLVGLLALFCRTRTDRRDDPKLLGEFALVVLTMLFLSERSWKHHYVTLLLPYTYLMWQFAYFEMKSWARACLASAMWGSVLLMATTSTELGGSLGSQGHKLAQAYGMFFWAGVVLYIATAWRVWVNRDRTAMPIQPETPLDSGAVPRPHYIVRPWRHTLPR
ncbi:MAG: hypothetical protein NVSMB9_00190 [Isosphaeraceae bacterium]